jgi:hypothetical protein
LIDPALLALINEQCAADKKVAAAGRKVPKPGSVDVAVLGHAHP